MLRIRPARLTDAPALTALVRRLTKTYITCDFTRQGRASLLESMTLWRISTYLVRGHDYHVALDGGRIVGVIGVRGKRHLYHLYVDDAFHRRGVARALWQHVLAAFRSRGVGGRLTVNSSRYAEPVYRRFGFRRAGQERERNGVVTVPMVFELPDS